MTSENAKLGQQEPVERATPIYADLSRWDNLYEAWRKAAKGKRGRPAAAAFEYRLEENLIELQDELRDGHYRPGAYSSFYIHDPKKRLISAAPFRDRIVHHALCRIIEPLFEKSFIHHSYANRRGKGTHRALDAAQRWMRRYRYVMPCDIRQFFPAVDHAILARILDRKIKCAAIRRMMRDILASGAGIHQQAYQMVYFPGDDLFALNRPRGLPIGNLTSQFWANVYLDGFDHFINRNLGCGAYLRYVDDFLLFADSKATLWRYKTAIVDRLSSLRLSLHNRQSQPRPTRVGIRFLGFVLYPDHRRLLRRKGIQFRRRIKHLKSRYLQGGGDVSKMEINNALKGWINHVRYADTWGLRRTILEEVGIWPTYKEACPYLPRPSTS